MPRKWKQSKCQYGIKHIEKEIIFIAGSLMIHCGLAKKVTMMLMIIIMIKKLYIFNNDF